MLQEIYIKNFAIVSNLRIPFREGLNVITGETGTGKSIIINALELALGARARAEVVSEGSEEAEVIAVFEPPDNLNLPAGFEPQEEPIIIRRTVARNGKTRVYLNDRAITLKSISELGDTLVDIHGQHEHQSLLRPATHRLLLDSYAGLHELADEVKELYKRLQALKARLDELQSTRRQRAQRIDLLRYQIQEIEEASLRPEEEQELRTEREIQRNMTNLLYHIEHSLSLLKEEEGSILDRLYQVRSSVEEITRLDPSAQETLNMLSDVEALTSEIALQLRGLKDHYDANPERLNEIERRLDLIDRLKHKYGDSIEEILDYLEGARKELQELLAAEEQGDDLSEMIASVEEELLEKAKLLSKKRYEMAEEIEKKITQVLKSLAMKNATFKVALTKTDITEHGLEEVEFLFSANPGQPPKPLNRVASGGELSRVMLAIKSIFAHTDGIPVLVFDEVDAGIGGITAEAVGERLKALSRHHQVICITHLPQIAVKADHHLCVRKQEKKDKTEVEVSELTGNDRIEEIARMLGGSITKTSIKHAKELLEKNKNC
ncbi:MAG: DNA repair protein RecN [Nitrospirae bacterium]|nr:DNA repair protein RecN [Nitrospirota bacterium]